MKTSLLTLLLIAGLFQATQAQPSPIHFGVRAGGSVSFLKYEPASGANELAGLGFYGGGFLNIPLNSTWSLRPELLFVLESGKYSENFVSFDTNGRPSGIINVITKPKFTSLRVPLLVQWSSGSYQAGRVGIVAGPIFDYLLSLKENVDFAPNGYVLDYTESADRFHIGITAGIEYNITDNLTIDVRSLYNINNQSQIPWRTLRWTMSIGAGYRF